MEIWNKQAKVRKTATFSASMTVSDNKNENTLDAAHDNTRCTAIPESSQHPPICITD